MAGGEGKRGRFLAGRRRKRCAAQAAATLCPAAARHRHRDSTGTHRAREAASEISLKGEGCAWCGMAVQTPSSRALAAGQAGSTTGDVRAVSLWDCCYITMRPSHQEGAYSFCLCNLFLLSVQLRNLVFDTPW